MWAAAAICDNLNTGWSACKDKYAWAVACGAISLFVCIVMTILFLCSAGNAQKANPFVAVFLFLLWGAGVGVCTFWLPFGTAGGGYGIGVGNYANGYFGTWISFITSVKYMVSAVPQVASAMDKGPKDSGSSLVIIIFFASVTEMWAAAVICDTYHWVNTGCSDLPAWGVSVGAISAIICLIVIVLPMVGVQSLSGGMPMKIISVLLLVLWIVGAATLTFAYKSGGNSRNYGAWGYGMFTSVGNGYLGTWVSLFASFVLCYVTLLGGSIGAGGAGGQGGKI